MSDLNDIVRNFVDNDLSSLDRFGDKSQSFSLSPELIQESSTLDRPPAPGGTGTAAGSAKNGSTSSLQYFTPKEDSSEFGSLESGAQNGQKHSLNGGVSTGGAGASGGAPGGAFGAQSAVNNAVNGAKGTVDGAVDGASRSASNFASTTSNGVRQVSSGGTPTTPESGDLVNPKRTSFGNKLKAFGKRITSGSSR